jgi:oligosaccharide reducing-end xylanase
VYCQNATPAALSAVGSELRWYSSATSQDGSVTPPVVSTTAAGVFEYFVSQTVNGCQSPRAKLTVTVHHNPATPTIAGNNTFCADGSTVLTSSAASGNQWYKGPDLINGATDQTLTVTQPGLYSVRCATPTTAWLLQLPLKLPARRFRLPPSAVRSPYARGVARCSLPVPPRATSGTSTASVLTDQTGQSLVVTREGNYSLTLTQDGCSVTSASVRVSVTPAPVAPLASSTGPVCVGGSLTLAANAPIGVTYGQPVYAWSGPDGFSSSLQSPTLSNVTAGAGGTYSVSVTVKVAPAPGYRQRYR